MRALLERIAERQDRRLLPEANRLYAQIERDLSFAELESYFIAPEEWGDAYLIVRIAPGDAQAPHWAGQLIEAYIGWAARRGFGCAVVDEAPPAMASGASHWRSRAVERTGCSRASAALTASLRLCESAKRAASTLHRCVSRCCRC